MILGNLGQLWALGLFAVFAFLFIVTWVVLKQKEQARRTPPPTPLQELGGTPPPPPPGMPGAPGMPGGMPAGMPGAPVMPGGMPAGMPSAPGMPGGMPVAPPPAAAAPPAPVKKKGIVAALLRVWDNPLKRIVGLCFLVGFIVVFAVSILAFTSSPIFCTKPCHSMDPLTAGWKESSHSEIPCINCHVESNNAIMLVYHKAMALKEPFVEISGGYKEGINKESELSEEMPEEHCTVCHSENRKTTPSGKLNFSTKSHESHAKMHVKCAFCHNRVGHEDKTHKNHMNMDWCYEECHGSEAFMDDCTTCHTKTFAKSISEEEAEETLKEMKSLYKGGGEEEE